jgi:type III restriction enzyme
MSNPFFDHPILNSPYEYPRRHWQLDEDGQPTQKIVGNRRGAKFITPIPKPKKRKAAAQTGFVFDEGAGISTKEQQYTTSIINEVRSYVEAWRRLPNPNQWQVTPETGRLLQHWRYHKFSGVRPFFCQVEAAETAIWITEVAAHSTNGKRLLDHLAAANKDANPELMRLALAAAWLGFGGAFYAAAGAIIAVDVKSNIPIFCLILIRFLPTEIGSGRIRPGAVAG